MSRTGIIFISIWVEEVDFAADSGGGRLLPLSEKKAGGFCR